MRRDDWLAPALIYGGAALLGTAIYQRKATAAAEEAHPPIGRFIKVDGTTLHYVDIGSGPPVVLLHGVGTTLHDWFISGLVDELFRHHRVIAVDRPGHGYSPRPAGIDWTPERQARAIATMLHRLGAHDAVVVGHSWGVLPALSLALQHATFVRALVLLAGVYYPGASTAASTVSFVPSVPVIGPLARLTVAPALARAALPALIDVMFEPQPTTRRFRAEYPYGLVTRSGQLRASADDAASTDEATRRLAAHYGEIDCPTAVVTGSGDAIFDPDAQSRRFAAACGHARLVVVPAAGHMVHHSATARVAAAIYDVFTGELAAEDPGPPPDSAADDLAGDPAGAAGTARAKAATPAPVDAAPRDGTAGKAGGRRSATGGKAKGAAGPASAADGTRAGASPEPKR